MLPRIGLAGIVLAGLAFFSAGALAAPPKESLRQALETSAKENGDRLVGEAKGGELKDAKEVTLTFDVDPDKTYKLYGVCDNDCTELSVSARDAEDKFIDNSSGQDSDTPVIEIEDFKGETISVEVFMMNCEADPCAFAVSLAEDPNAGVRRTIDLSELIASGSSSRPSETVSQKTEAELAAELGGNVLPHLTLVGEVGTGKLATGEAKRYFYDADPAAIYDGFARCDCANLDLSLRDDDDHALDSDSDYDNRPIVQISSDNWPEGRRSGRQKLVLEVKMKECGRDSCNFAAAVYKAN